jgi:16S rRNA (uracil1498-N3)-methyltransferase
MLLIRNGKEKYFLMPASHFKNIDFFYTEPSNISGENLFLSGDEFFHLKKSLRKRVDDEIFVIDGFGYIYHCTISNFEKSKVECKIIERSLSENENAVRIDLAASLLKNPSRFELIIEKTTEIGVNKIIPFKSEFTISNSLKKERWKQIAISAMKQSQRAFLPEIDDLKDIENIINSEYDLKLIADRESGTPLSQINLIVTGKVLVMIGPEGGFTDSEIESAEKNGFIKVNIGRNRLRSETAAIVIISRMLTP